MKKITLFFSALLFSLMSMAGTATISFADKTNRTTFSNNQQVWEQNGIVVTNDKAASTSNVGDYANPARFYKSSSLTIGCTLGNITKIEVTCASADYATALVNSVGAEASANAAVVTIVPAAVNATYSVAVLTAQVRVAEMTITYEGEGGETPETPTEPETPETPETPDDGGETPEDTELVIPEEAKDWNIPAEAIDVLKAREICADLASGATTGTKYYVMGYVKKIHNKHIDGVTNFGNAQFYMENVKGANSADDFMAYQVYGLNGEKITDPNVVAVGDFVVVYGELTNYNGTYETVGKGAAHIWNSTNPLLSGETPDDGDETPANITFDFTTEEGLEALGIAYPTTDAGNGAYSTDLEEGKAYSQNGISLTAKYGSTATRIWLAASGKLELRHYKGGVLTFAAPAGKVITNIVFDGADVSGLTTLVDKAWTGNASTVEIPAAADAKTIKINTITVHLADASSDYVATPVISGETNFLENTTVTITAEEGLEVYYTLDGTDPTKASTKYTAPFELTATTTVKAIAYNGDKASAVVEKTFTKMTILTCAEAVALCTETVTAEKHIIRGYLTEYQEEYNAQYKNMTFWMADATDGGKVLLAYRVKPLTETEQTLKVGDFVEVVGNLILYGETPEVNAGGTVELITAAETAVENITLENKAMKIIENGQIVILKNGVRYNILGAVVK